MAIISDSLQFVQVQADTAYIDTRVYCAEIIQVDHSAWFRDTLKKYQSTIEQRFGLIEFQTHYVNIPNGGKKEGRHGLLTEAQVNACLVLSKNLSKTIPAKMQLVADFERAKEALKLQFTRQLLASVDASIADNTRYNITVYAVWRDSGIRNPSYVKDVILAHYDYRIVNQFICVTQQTYEDLLENFRAMDGAVVDKLPAEKRRKFRHSDYSKMNRREPQIRDANYGILDLQLSLFDA